jgi:hypothetical protein
MNATAEFTTAKGSTYKVTPLGSTIRDKAARPEHPGDQGIYPESEMTFYVTSDDADKLGEVQVKGSTKGIEVRGNMAAVKYLDGPHAGKFERRTLVKIQRTPAVGLTPVELWKGGNRVHFGNEITKVRAMNPTFEEVDDVTEEEIMEAAIRDKERITKSMREWTNTLTMMYPKGVISFKGDAFNMYAVFTRDPHMMIGKWNGHYGAIFDEARPYKPTVGAGHDEPAPVRRNNNFDRHGVNFSDDDEFYMEGIEKMTTPEFSLLKEIAVAQETTPVEQAAVEPVVEEAVVEASKKSLKDYIKKPVASVVEEAVSPFPALADYAKRQVEGEKVSEEVVSELSKTHLKNYVKAATNDVDDKAYHNGTMVDKKSKAVDRAFDKNERRIEKRKKGIATALDKV